MKTLKTLILALGLLCAQQVTNASTLTDDGEEKAVKSVLSTYIDAFCHGKIKGFASLLDDDLKMTTKRGKKVITFSKSEVLESLRTTAHVEQNCQTGFEIVEQTPGQIIAKVNMDYGSFVKENFLTLVETEKGWKINRISTAYK